MAGLQEIAEQGYLAGREARESSPEYINQQKKAELELKSMKRAEEKARMDDLIDAGASFAAAYGGEEAMLDFYKMVDPKKAMALKSNQEKLRAEVLANNEKDVKVTKDISAILGGAYNKLQQIADPEKQKEYYSGAILPLAKQFKVDMPKELNSLAYNKLGGFNLMNVSPDKQYEVERGIVGEIGKKLSDIRAQGKLEGSSVEEVQKELNNLEGTTYKDAQSFNTNFEKDYKLQRDASQVADQISYLLDTDSNFGGTAAAYKIVRLVQGAGIITDKDVAMFQGQGMLPTKAANIVADLFGVDINKMSKANAEQIKSFAERMKSKTKEEIGRIANKGIRMTTSKGWDPMVSLGSYSNDILDAQQDRIESTFNEVMKAAPNSDPNVVKQKIRNSILQETFSEVF